MTGFQLLFIINGLVILFAAVMSVTARRMIHAALWFVLALLGVAVMFTMLEAGFFAVVQVLIYIGAIAILIIFAVMLTRRSLEDQDKVFNGTRLFTLLLVGVIFVGLTLAIRAWPYLNASMTPLPGDQMTVASLGLALIDPQQFSLPFEVTSILLLAAMIGAFYVAYERKEDRK